MIRSNTILICLLQYWFLLFPYFLPHFSLAEDPPEKQNETEIFVTAKKINSDHVVFIRKEIQQLQASELKDLLSTTMGVDFSSQGSVGQFQSVFIRGGSSDQCLVILDGMILNDMSSPAGGFDFSWLNPKLIDKIEVYKNPKGAIFGAGATSGAIVITTIRPVDKSFLNLEAGSNDQQSMQLTKTFRNQFLISGNYLSNNSISSADAKFNNTEKDPAQKSQVLLKYENTFSSDGQFNIKSLITNATNKYDRFGGPGGDDLNAKTNTKSQNYSLELLKMLDKNLSLLLRFGMSSVDREDENPRDYIGDFYLSGKYENQSYRTDLDLDYDQSSFGLKLKSYIQYDIINIDSAYLGGVEYLKDHYDSKGIAFLFDIDLNEETALSPNLRFDCRSNLCQSMTEFTVQQNISSAINFEVSGGRSIKFPTLYQKYAIPYGTVDLNPETVDFKAIKLEWNSEVFVSEIELYQKLYHNLIDFSASSKYENLKNVTAQGVDFENKWIFYRNELSLNLAYQEAMNDLSSTLLPRRARTQFAIQEKYLWSDRLDLLLNISGRGPRNDFDASFAPTQLSAYTLYDVIAHYSIDGKNDLYIKLLNLTNVKYEETWGYGTEGRRVFISWFSALDE